MDKLSYYRFSEETIPLFSGFSCGDTRFARELSAWISNEQDDRDVRHAMANEKTEVWYYKNPEGLIVGYASLAPTKWRIKFGDLEPIPIEVNVLPALAVAEEFQGRPTGDDQKKNRYWAQMVRDIIRRARRRKSRAPLLGLFVHPENEIAKTCYSKFKFAPDPEQEFSYYTNMFYQAMLLDLREATEYSAQHKDIWFPSPGH